MIRISEDKELNSSEENLDEEELLGDGNKIT